MATTIFYYHPCGGGGDITKIYGGGSSDTSNESSPLLYDDDDDDSSPPPPGDNVPPPHNNNDTDPKIFLQRQFTNIKDVSKYHVIRQSNGMNQRNWIPAGLPYEMWEKTVSENTAATTTFLYVILDIIYKLCLPLCPIEQFFYQCPFTVPTVIDNNSIEKILKTDVSLIYLIESGKMKFNRNFLVKVKRGVYFNTGTKTVFKFLTDPSKVIDFLTEALICYNYGDVIGTKRCLTFYPHIMCAEYSYEGPDIRCLYTNSPTMLYYTSLMYDEVGSEVFNHIRIYFIRNILQILSSICNIARNLSLLGLSFSDFKPDNFAFNKITQKVTLIDGEMIYPFAYERLVNNKKKKLPQMKNLMVKHPQTPPEYFNDGQLSEYSTVYGLQYTLSEIMSSVYHEKSSFYWDNTLHIIEMISDDVSYKNLSENARNIHPFRRPTVQEFINFFNNYRE